MRTRGLRLCSVGAAGLLLILALAAGCGEDAPGPGAIDAAGDAPGTLDAAVDAGADAVTTDARFDGAAGADAGRTACQPNGTCGAGQFCSDASQTCISAVTAVAPGTFHTCALHANGRVSCWGDTQFIRPGPAQLTGPIDVPLGRRATAVVAGAQASCALMDDGSVRCWGVLGDTLLAPGPVVKEDGTQLGGVTQIAGGTLTFCAGTPAGTHCWGENRASELARPDSQTFGPLTAVLSQPGPRPLLAATVAIVVHDGKGQLCGWGNNDSGLVPGARGIVAQPTCVEQITDVLQLSAGDGHVCARRAGNMFACWGSNSGGQLGVGDDGVLDMVLPGMTRTLPAKISSITAGGYHTCALLETGAVMCWGSNEHGECGVPVSAPQFSPVRAAGPAFVAINSGAEAAHTCGVRADGQVQCWGTDERGQLGSGATTEDSSRMSAVPVSVKW
jgi:alpha-tubulin suppressor-like RCC1 family protein